MTTGFITHALCKQHDMGDLHPERPERLAAIENRLMEEGIWSFLRHIEAQPATREQLARIHPTEYIDGLQAACPSEGLVALDPDTWMNPQSYRAALMASGAVVQAAELVVAGELDNAFCSVRPPGHHAERELACGFCFFNNVACAVSHALAELGITRVAVADFDVHHGNGTEHMFRANDRVLVCSSFQYPFYPHTPLNTSDRNIVCSPLRAGAGSAEFRAVVEKQWLPAMEAFEPEMIFISAGFDAHRADPLAQLCLVEDDYIWVTQQLMDVAKRFAHGRVVSSLEGGYDLPALGRSATAHIRTLAEL